MNSTLMYKQLTSLLPRSNDNQKAKLLIGQRHHPDLTSRLACKDRVEVPYGVNTIVHFLCENVKSTWNSKGFTSNVVTTFDGSILTRNKCFIPNQRPGCNITYEGVVVLIKYHTKPFTQTFNNLSPTSIISTLMWQLHYPCSSSALPTNSWSSSSFLFQGMNTGA